MFSLSYAVTCWTFQNAYRLNVNPLTLKDVTECLEKAQYKHPEYWIVVPAHEIESIEVLHITRKVICVAPTLDAVWAFRQRILHSHLECYVRKYVHDNQGYDHEKLVQNRNNIKYYGINILGI